MEFFQVRYSCAETEMFFSTHRIGQVLGRPRPIRSENLGNTETIFLETIHTYIICIYWMVKEYTCPHFPGWKTDIKEDDVKYRFSITIIMSLLFFFAWECFASFCDVVHVTLK